MTLRVRLAVAGAPRPGHGWARYALACGAASLVYACSHAWDDYDPRLAASSSSATGSGSSSSGTLEGGPCAPPETRPCYTGDPTTSGTLPCMPGTQTCGADGTWGDTCAGQVLPKLEDCTNDVDDDCNGAINDHCAMWSMGFGVAAAGSGNQVYGVAAAPGGQVRVVGGSHGGALLSADDGGVALTDAATGAFSIDIDAAPPASVERLGGSTSAATAAVLDADGGAILAAVVYGNQELLLSGLSPLKSTTASYEWDSLVAHLSGATGLWQTMFYGDVPVNALVQINAVTWSGGARVFAAGTFTGTSDFDLDGGAGDAGDAGSDAGDDITLTSKNLSGVVVRVDGTAAGPSTVWQVKLGDTNASAYAVTADESTTVIAAGAYSDAPLKLGTKSFPGTGQPAGLVVSIAQGSGIPQRAVTYPSTGGAVSAVRVDSIVADPTAPDVIIAGRFGGPVQFGAASADVTDAGAPDAGADGGAGCGLIKPLGASDLFVARLHVADLACVWVQTFTTAAGFDGPNNAGTPNAFPARTQGFGPQVAVDPSTGNILVAANFASAVTIAGWTLTPVGTSSVLLIGLDGGGTPHWVRGFGTDRAYVTGMALDGTGAALLVGEFLGNLQFEPDHPLFWSQASGHDGMFIAKIAP